MAETDKQLTLRTGSPPAPGNLALLEGFLNTWSGELGVEDLGTVRATEAWLKQFGLWSGNRKLTSDQRQKIIEFREVLRTWVLDDRASDPISTSLFDVAFRVEVNDGDLIFLPVGNDPHQFLVGSLINVISNSQQNSTWDRFKCCELPSCGWAFYDSTRSRTKRWCSMKTCGSRHKAREYYKRKR